MFKKIAMLIILLISSATIFISCGIGQKNGIPPSKAKNFIDFAAMDDYSNPIIRGMELDLLPSSNLRWAGDLMDSEDNESVFYTFIRQPDKRFNTQAIYKYGESQFFGVEIIGTGTDKKLKFVFDNTTDNRSVFFETEELVNFKESETKNSIPESIDNFVNLSAGAGYKFLNEEQFSLSNNSIISDDNIIYVFDDELGDNKTHAIYKSTSIVSDHQYIGAELMNDDTPRRIEFFVNNLSSNPEYFYSASDVVFQNQAIQYMPKNTFLDNAAGKTFQLIIENIGTSTLLGDTVETAGDIIHKGITYEYVSEGSSSTAVYKRVGANAFFGVEIDDDKLNFYFDNSSGDPIYWTTSGSVKYQSGTDAIIATRPRNSALSRRVPSDNITTLAGQVPSDGIISMLFDSNKIYVAVKSSVAGQSGTLFTGVFDPLGVIVTRSQISSTAVSNMNSNSLQVVDDKLYIVSRVGDKVKIFNKKGGQLPDKVGYDNEITTTNYVVGASANDEFVIASNGSSESTGKYRKIGKNGFISNPIELKEASIVPSSIAIVFSDIFVAGTSDKMVKVNRVSGNSSIIASLTGSDGKLINIGNVLYIILTNNGATEMYKLMSGYSDKVLGAVLPFDLESVVVDDKYIYATSRVPNSNLLETYVYIVYNTTLIEVAKGDDIDIVGSVTPAIVSLGSELGILIVDVENIGGKNVFRYNNLIVADGPFIMP